ncbi:hypothetical protein [Nocardia sp. NBC_00511]|uniref:hypothetical protein n=1 Tax=Nocardia sp. NBC_00511 TaxID=2903591 RepID=UPI002F911F32
MPADIAHGEFDCAAAPSGLSARYRRDWRSFAVWCAAGEVSALPAVPLTLLEYLADNPGRPATQAGRVTAINRAHRAAGLPAPGRAEELRQALDQARAAQSTRWRTAVDALLPLIPTWGWPGGLVGRRNGALLVLRAAGMSYADIGRLTVGDVRVEPGAIHIGPQPLSTINASIDSQPCHASTLHAWLDVRPALQRYSGNAMLEAALESGTVPGITIDAVGVDQPLFVTLDKHGYAPMPCIDRRGASPALPGLSAEAVSAIVTRHLSGDLPKYVVQQKNTATESRVDVVADLGGNTSLSADYFDKGIAARRRDHETLSAIPDLLDDAVARMEKLLDQTSDMLRLALGHE